MKSIIVDVSKCTGCFNCQIACKDEHVDNDWLPYAKRQPEVGQFWMKLDEVVRGTAPKVKLSYVAQPCMHCADAPCIPACTKNAIVRRKDGIVLIDPETCVGDGDCISGCPYGAIYKNEETKMAQKCTMCAHLLDRGWKEPRCVDACPTDALTFGEVEDLKGKGAEVLHPEYGTKPNVIYFGLPKRFIAGALVDKGTNECLQDALVVATDTGTGKTYSSKSDNYGDFWFEGLEVEHKYSIKVEKTGYEPKIIDPVTTEKDVNLGDIFVSRAGS